MKTKKRNFLYKLSSIRSLAFSFLGKELQAKGIDDIPPSFGDILFIINSLGECFVQDIVKHSYRDKSTVSNIIRKLEQNGYVEKFSDQYDGRKVKIRLTEKCHSHLYSMLEISEKLKNKLFHKMSNEEIEILFLLINKIEKNISFSFDKN
ncbi:MAG: winged helix-turn-helix transcriptional regulator [Desulfobacteraceae bacterium]|nr:winged helix-turn-helix transcriptional regulator [Desulfobacteraceae bacterium]